MTDAPDGFHLLRRLLDTPAPSGFERPGARLLAAFARRVGPDLDFVAR